MKRDENAYITVETIGAFVPFLLLVASILSLVNIVTVQASIHHAMTQTAGALSMYCYVTKAAGISDEILQINGKAVKFSDSVSDVLGGINAITGEDGDIDDAEKMFDVIESAADDPEEIIKGLANYGVNEIKGAAAIAIAKPLLERYLTPSEGTDEYFKRFRIVAFNITDCTIIDSNENVKLTVEYEVEYTFGMMRLPFVPTLNITQTVATKAWLGGSGEGYKG